jgi:hypothetical protein
MIGHRRDSGVAGCSSRVPARILPRSRLSVEIELVALDVLHHDARLVVVIGRQ